MMNHNQMVEDMLYKIEPNYDSISEERKQKLKCLVETYLNPETSNDQKKAIINRLGTTKILSDTVHPMTPTNDHNMVQISKGRINKNVKQNKMIKNTEFDSINSLFFLCYMNNERILKMQEEQQNILKSLVDLQKQYLEREHKMMDVIQHQQTLITVMREKEEMQQSLIADLEEKAEIQQKMIQTLQEIKEGE